MQCPVLCSGLVLQVAAISRLRVPAAGVAATMGMDVKMPDSRAPGKWPVNPCSLCGGVTSCLALPLDDLVAIIVAAEPRARAVAMCWGSTHYSPFRAFIGFSSGDPQEDEIVAAVMGIWDRGAGFEFTCDTSTGEGAIFSEAPARTFAGVPGSADYREWAIGCVEYGLAWIRAQVPEMIAIVRHHFGDQ